MEPAPAPYAKEMVGAAQFYTNKILKEHKGKCDSLTQSCGHYFRIE